jgi:hypothetical protein
VQSMVRLPESLCSSGALLLPAVEGLAEGTNMIVRRGVVARTAPLSCGMACLYR